MILDPYKIEDDKSYCFEFGHIDVLPFARAAFLSMVVSNTEAEAEECREILELIFTKFHEFKGDRLLNVVNNVRRMQKLGVKLFKCVDQC